MSANSSAVTHASHQFLSRQVILLFRSLGLRLHVTQLSLIFEHKDHLVAPSLYHYITPDAPVLSSPTDGNTKMCKSLSLLYDCTHTVLFKTSTCRATYGHRPVSSNNTSDVASNRPACHGYRSALDFHLRIKHPCGPCALIVAKERRAQEKERIDKEIEDLEMAVKASKCGLQAMNIDCTSKTPSSRSSELALGKSYSIIRSRHDSVTRMDGIRSHSEENFDPKLNNVEHERHRTLTSTLDNLRRQREELIRGDDTFIWALARLFPTVRMPSQITRSRCTGSKINGGSSLKNEILPEEVEESATPLSGASGDLAESDRSDTEDTWEDWARRSLQLEMDSTAVEAVATPVETELITSLESPSLDTTPLVPEDYVDEGFVAYNTSSHDSCGETDFAFESFALKGNGDSWGIEQDDTFAQEHDWGYDDDGKPAANCTGINEDANDKLPLTYPNGDHKTWHDESAEDTETASMDSTLTTVIADEDSGVWAQKAHADDHKTSQRSIHKLGAPTVVSPRSANGTNTATGAAKEPRTVPDAEPESETRLTTNHGAQSYTGTKMPLRHAAGMCQTESALECKGFEFLKGVGLLSI